MIIDVYEVDESCWVQMVKYYLGYSFIPSDYSEDEW